MIAIIDYEAGNLTSVELAIRHVGGQCIVTKNPEEVSKAERVIFPGVGSAASCMENLKRMKLDTALKSAVDAGKPVLAICIGEQLIFDHSEEDGGVDCIGLLPGNVVKFEFDHHVKIPHMGWNSVQIVKPHPLLAGFPENGETYFVHSYYTVAANNEDVFCQTEYEGKVFTSAAGKNNLFATQFHPEKSGKAGLGILKNFLTWDGKL